MAGDDRERWNRRYAAGSHTGPAAAFVVEAAAYLPATGRALDVAGGAGRHAVWLAARGLAVTLVDVSDEGLVLARRRAAAAGVEVDTVRADLTAEPLPPGPWDVIICFHYLQRDLFPAFAGALAPGGTLVFAQATERNLERHSRPSRRFLLAEGEAAALIRGAGLDIVTADEGWDRAGHHEARVIARASLRK